jgi:hypothetical protein
MAERHADQPDLHTAADAANRLGTDAERRLGEPAHGLSSAQIGSAAPQKARISKRWSRLGESADLPLSARSGAGRYLIRGERVLRCLPSCCLVRAP